MTVLIDKDLCNGCPARQEGCCEEVCPGDLFYRDNGQACLREPADCWDCFACVKACPRAALSVELPFQISEARNRLYARQRGEHIIWNLCERQGKVIAEFRIRNRQAPETKSPETPLLEKKGNHD
jgi:adenylylsulfate reductase, subunit B